MQSMTGFARAEASHAGNLIVWELKSVNGKTADIRLRLPPGLERIEQPARLAAQRRFARGNLSATLTLTRAGPSSMPVVNEGLLKDLAGLARRLEQEFGCAPASSDGLLSLRGVLEASAGDPEREGAADLDAAILACLATALDRLEASRREEGATLVGFLTAQVARVEELTLRAEADPSRQPAAIRERLRQQLVPLLEASPQLDDSRLYQEAALLATRADIREELDRLNAHVAAARALLSGDGAVGRKLDFLAQEFNREANTLCSKSNAAALTAIGLDLKAVVDQFREQVQNLE
jgi:uncharacterized protein (TIGR00255 family)